ncbi:MAG: hypothetical protein QNJ23_10010 [Woeseiaceae bacterium]|nr:hypothetical protein [Woeseiaceae bacterium]
MLIVWRGLGWLVPVIVMAALILSQASVDAVYGDGFYTANAWPKQAAFVAAALAVGVLGFFLNYKLRKVLINEETGEAVGKAPSHTLFFIPVEYWAVIVLALFFWPLP